MNAIGIAIVWCVLQVTLIGLLASGLYVLLRRLRPSTAQSILFSGLLMVVILSLLALNAWPRWTLLGSVQSTNETINAAPLSSGNLSATSDLTSVSEKQTNGEQEKTNSRSNSVANVWQALVESLTASQAASSENTWRWPAMLAAMLLTLMVFRFGWLLLGVLAVRRQRLHSRTVLDIKLLKLIEMLCKELGCHRPIEVRQCDDLVTAATIGWLRPTLLLPADWTLWTPDQRRAVLAHEIAHARGHDFLALLLGQLGLVLHFYHPLVHWLVNRLRLEQELAADAVAASVSGGRHQYLKTIAELALYQQDRPVLWPVRMFLPTRTTFLRRITMLRDSKLGIDRVSPTTRLSTIGIVLLCGIFVSGIRGPGNSGQVLADDKEKQAESADNEDATKSANIGSSKNFEAKFPSGIVVELLGISESPSVDRPWWRPDGSPLQNRPTHAGANNAYDNRDNIAREFDVVVRNLPSEEVGTIIQIEPKYNSAGEATSLENLGNGPVQYHNIAVNMSKRKTVTFRYGVADGPWHTVHESKRGSEAISTKSGSYIFSQPKEKEGSIFIAVTHDIQGPDARVIAVGINGKEFIPTRSNGAGANNFYQFMAEFDNIPLKDIRGFCLQTRPYKWVEFRNVSLRPGEKTDVQIVFPDSSAN